MIPVLVVTHRSRAKMAHQLAKEVGPGVHLIVDRDDEGCSRNHLKAYEALNRSTSTSDWEWVCVLEDDAVLCDDFRGQLEAVAAAAPEPFVSLYLGLQMPPQWQPKIASVIAPIDEDPNFLVCDRVLHTVGMLVRAEYVQHIWEWFTIVLEDNPEMEADTLWTSFVQYSNSAAMTEPLLRVAYTRPSLLDHADAPSIIPVSARWDGQEREPGRVAWLHDGRDEWNSSVLEIPSPYAGPYMGQV